MISPQNPAELDNYKRRLGMQYAKANCSGKIWCFWNECWEEEGSTDTIQQLTINYKFESGHMTCLRKHQAPVGEGNDKPWWTGILGSFHQVRLAQMRKKKEERRDYNLLWNKGVPFKVNFSYGRYGRGGYLPMTI
ncbi:hypothetical protein H5410_032980 [Solanum commersonii]|uniref:Uncharacterized protein n=1 Tax=Solanum commersonii TaxID=4109 RepID=A0A9J5YME2_SOLCO|nr:hypothetical protein H5410_032980 [Solanum commersonii]